MSSERGVRNPSTESPRVPGEGYSSQGESGPKARPKGVVDGHQVNIPGLKYNMGRMMKDGTHYDM